MIPDKIIIICADDKEVEIPMHYIANIAKDPHGGIVTAPAQFKTFYNIIAEDLKSEDPETHIVPLLFPTIDSELLNQILDNYCKQYDKDIKNFDRFSAIADPPKPFTTNFETGIDKHYCKIISIFEQFGEINDPKLDNAHDDWLIVYRLVKFLLLADFLEIDFLIKLLNVRIHTLIDDKSIDEIRYHMGYEDDLTDEEKKKLQEDFKYREERTIKE